MNTTENAIMAIEYRIHLLTMRNPIGNYRIVQKLKRRLRNLQK